VNKSGRKRRRVRAITSLVFYLREVPDTRFADHPELRGGIIREPVIRLCVKGKLSNDGLMRPKSRKRKCAA
jgi:hypothetical protein